MYSCLVSYNGWAEGRDSILASRVFEYTDAPLLTTFAPNGVIDFERVLRLPALFVQEVSASDNSFARIGTIFRARPSGKEVMLEYAFDPDIPPISIRALQSIAGELGLGEWELNRTHWAIKDEDLFRALIRIVQPRRSQPRVFTLSHSSDVEPTLVSVMMPFDPSFDAVYQTLKDAAQEADLHCRRADDIWDDPAVIQDVVNLIDRSKVVICDCTGRNPNVFYETGIAHTLGRDVILITQNEADIPFDLRHLRFLKYLNNSEGRKALTARLEPRLRELAAS